MTLTFEFLGHLNLGKTHILSSRCVEYPAIHREQVTKYNRRDVPTTSKVFYFVDDPYDKAEYTTLAAALATLGVEVSHATE